MKKIILAVVCFCVALMPSQILGSLEEFLNKMAEDGKNINGVFYPSKNGYLGKGPLSIAYKGKLSPSTDVEIAMKFTHNVFKKYAVREYEIYTCLNAIDNATVEAYGIPSVSYYGSWKNFILMATTLLDSKFWNICIGRYLPEIDFLIVFREFVRISKYIHSHGILHNNIHLGNMMIRNNRVFVVDFSEASRFYIDDAHVPSTRISESISQSWQPMGIKETEKEWIFFMNKFIEVFENHSHDSGAVSRVMSKIHALYERYNAVYYDVIYEDIDQEINRINRNGTAFLSWLTAEQRRMATYEPIAPIDSIKQPSDRAKFRYPEINYNYFVKAANHANDMDLDYGNDMDLD